MRRAYGLEFIMDNMDLWSGGMSVFHSVMSIEKSSDTFFIFQQEEDLLLVAETLKEFVLQTHPLIKVNNWHPSYEDLSDVGYTSSDHVVYFFAELIAVFTREGESAESLPMFHLQIEEDFIGCTTDEKPFYVIHKNDQELIEKYGEVYNVKIHWQDWQALDK